MAWHVLHSTSVNQFIDQASQPVDGFQLEVLLMKRFFSMSLAAGLCLALAGMFVPSERAEAQFSINVGPGGVGLGYGNSGYGGYGGYRGSYGNYGNRGYNNFGYGSNYGYGRSGIGFSYGYGNPYYGGRPFNNSYGYGNQYYGNRGYGYSNSSPRYSNSYQYAQPSYQYSQSAPRQVVVREDTRPNRPVMGVRIRSAGDGVRVVEVRPDSPAAKAGLQVGDLITSFNGRRVTTQEALLNELEQLKPNANTQLTVRTENQTWDTNLQLTTYGQAYTGNEQDQPHSVARPMLNDQLPPPKNQQNKDSLPLERNAPAPDNAPNLDIPEPPTAAETESPNAT